MRRLDAAESRSTLEWSRSPDGPAPMPDADRRETLNRILTSARSAAGAAKTAEAAIAAEINVESAKVGAVAQHVTPLIGMIVADEIEPLIAAYATVARTAAAQRARLIQGWELLRDLAERSPQHLAGDVYRKVEMLDAEIRNAFSITSADSGVEVASRLSWQSLVAGLAVDAATKLAEA